MVLLLTYVISLVSFHAYMNDVSTNWKYLWIYIGFTISFNIYNIFIVKPLHYEIKYSNYIRFIITWLMAFYAGYLVYTTGETHVIYSIISGIVLVLLEPPKKKKKI